MKAWMIEDIDHEGATIVFNNNETNARSNGAFEIGSEYEYVTCIRKKEFDQYSEAGFVPVEILIKKHGWWWGCFHCSNHVNEETENPVYIPQGVYCSPECQQERANEIEKINSEYEQFQICILQNYTWLDIVKFSGGFPIKTPSVYFTFPGAKYKSQLSAQNNLKQKEYCYYVPNGDLEAFKKWAKTIKWMV